MPSALETPSTRLHVDELILDYLLWYCTSSLLSERLLRADGDTKHQYAEASRNSDMGMKLVNSFYQTFQRLHPHSPLPEPISLRLRICRFAAMLLRRVDVTAPDFAPNSNACRGRALGWLKRRGLSSVLPENYNEFARPSTPFSADLLQKNAEALLESLGHNPDSFYGSATLRDAFWAFLLITAHISAKQAEVTDAWISNAVDFMMQAALEAYRCHGCAGIDALNECFAVGPTALGDMSDEEIMVNEIFGGDDGEVGRVFESLKAEGLEEMRPPQGVTLEAHFEALAKECPWKGFEERIFNYIVASSKSQARPTLAQLEQGRLEGYDSREIQAVLRNAGVSEEVWR
ncbi:hypothetical protein BDD12DRAFT_848281 [Trichophaea hybrida]|nr:hypothetical protein BDD12DRAFT_848281 [Trichophaea hybrida]